MPTTVGLGISIVHTYFNADAFPPPGQFGILMETTGYVLIELGDITLME